MSEKYIHELFAANKIPLKDCNLIGVRALQSRFKNVTTIFITADKAEIEHRLHARGDSPADIKMRMADYDQCMKEAQFFDHVLINDDLEKTIDKIIEIIYN